MPDLAPIGRWALTFLLQSTALVLLTVLVATRMRGASPAARALLWRAAFLGGIVTSLAAGAFDHAAAGARIEVSTPTAAPPPTRPVVEAPPPALATDVPLAAPVAPPTDPAPSAPFVPLWAWVWVAGTSIAIGLDAFRRRRFMAGIADRRPVEDAAAFAALGRVASRLGLRRRTRLTSSGRLHVPVAFGVLRPEVVVPASMGQLPTDRLEALLAHEVAHLVRWDPLRLRAARLVRALLWFQPLLRIPERRLRDAAELDCDSRAAGVVGGPIAMADCLAEVAARIRLPAPAACAMAACPSLLEVRVRRLLDGGWRPRGGLFRAAPLAAGVLLAVAALAPRAVPSLGPVAPVEEGPPAEASAEADPLRALDAEVARLEAEARALVDELRRGGLVADAAPLLDRIERRIVNLRARRDRVRTFQPGGTR